MSVARSQVVRTRAARIGLLALAGGACALSLSPIFVRLSELGPIATGFWRVAFAAPVLLSWMRLERGEDGARTPRRAGDWGLLALAGLFFAADLTAWHWSLQLTSVANAALLSNLSPIVVAPAARLLFGERIAPRFVAGMLLSVSGAALLLGRSLDVSLETALGDALALAASVLYAGYVLTVAKLRTRLSAATIMAWSAPASALFLVPAVLVSGETFVADTPYGWLVLLALALVTHCAGQGSIAYALAHLPASFSSVALLVTPVISAFLGWIVFAEPVGGLQALGAGIVLAGIVVARPVGRA
ncbi:MAG TPA: DMT family transporter [Gammaproteobacteria bacterium]